MQIRKETVSSNSDGAEKWKNITVQSEGGTDAKCTARSGNGEAANDQIYLLSHWLQEKGPKLILGFYKKFEIQPITGQ